MNLKSVILLALCVVLPSVYCYRILGIFPHPAKSHYIVGDALMKGLAAKGHDVTMISPHKQTKPIKNYRSIHLEQTIPDARKGVEAGNFINYNRLHSWEISNALYDVSINLTDSLSRSENFQRFIQEKEHFDVVIFEIFVCDAMVGLGHYFNAPIIGFSTIGPTKWTSDLVGISDNPSYMPYVSNGFSDKMNFWQRMYNSMSYWYEDITTPLIYLRAQQKMIEKIFPNSTEMPTIEQLRRNVSLVFVNSHVSYGIPQPLMPNLIEIGGVHVKQTTENLTADVQAFLDGAKHGAIYFSLGSNVKLSKLPDESKKMLANAFSDFPNVRILIKNEEDFVIPSHDPSNVLVRHWFNQEAILSHPNLKVFVTHGGLLSTTEAVHFGKPIVGIPVFFDQTLNMKMAQEKGYGINVPYEFLSESRIRSAIREMLTNSSYSDKAQQISQYFHDQQNTPMETAIHWVEYVAKHRGSLHLQSHGVHLPFYVYYNLDVWALIGSVICILIYVVVKLSIIRPSNRINYKKKIS